MRQPVGVEESPRVADLVTEIVEDVQQLVRQEFALARTEVKHEVQQAKLAALGLGVGAGLLGTGALLLTLCLVRLIERAGVALWLSYGIVAVLFFALGAAAMYWMRKQVKQIDPVPRETVRTMQENIQWLKKQK